MRLLMLIALLAIGYLFYTGGISLNDWAASDLKRGTEKVLSTSKEVAKKAVPVAKDLAQKAGESVKEILDE